MSKKFIYLLLATLVIAVIAGCEDDDVTDPGDHFEAVGIIIKQSGVTVLDYYGPDYQAGDTVAYLDTLELSLGINPHWDAFFYDEDGEEIDPPTNPEDGGDQSFAATFTPTIAELWWHEGEEGNFEFHVRGLQSGSGNVEFHVMHEGHADFTTLQIPVVIDTNVLHEEPIGVRLYDEETEALLATAWLADSAQVTGSLSVGANDSTDHIEAMFFDEEDTEFWPGAPPHSLVVTSSDTTVVTIGGQEVDEPWAFRLLGHNAGNATITVFIYHDGDAEIEFSPITVTVE